MKVFNVNIDVKYIILSSTQEDIKSLCSHGMEIHIKDLEAVTYVTTFKSLKMRYEQQQDRLKEKASLDK